MLGRWRDVKPGLKDCYAQSKKPECKSFEWCIKVVKKCWSSFKNTKEYSHFSLLKVDDSIQNWANSKIQIKIWKRKIVNILVILARKIAITLFTFKYKCSSYRKMMQLKISSKGKTLIYWSYPWKETLSLDYEYLSLSISLSLCVSLSMTPSLTPALRHFEWSTVCRKPQKRFESTQA